MPSRTCPSRWSRVRAIRKSTPRDVVGRGTKRSAVRVDDAGIRLPRGFSGSADVVFDGRRVWSFSVDKPADDAQTVVWPKRMKRMLDGRVEVRIVAADREIFAEERQFGTSSERIRLVDAQGTPIVVDKWGLIQRPFEGRDPGVIDMMADRATEILRVMREDCGF